MSSKPYPSFLSSDDNLLHQYYDDYLQLDYNDPGRVNQVCSNFAGRVVTIFHDSVYVHITNQLKNNRKICSETIRQETFLRFIKSVRKPKPVAKRQINKSLIALLKDIANKTITDYWRKIYRQKASQLTQEIHTMETDIVDPNTINWSQAPFESEVFSLPDERCLEIFQGICARLNLTHNSRVILKLRLLQRMSTDDIGEELGLKPKSAKQAIRRIAKRLNAQGINRNNLLDNF